MDPNHDASIISIKQISYLNLYFKESGLLKEQQQAYERFFVNILVVMFSIKIQNPL